MSPWGPSLKTPSQGQNGAHEGKASGQIPIWITELMGLADGLDVGVKCDFSWGLSIRRKDGDGKNKFRKLIIAQLG